MQLETEILAGQGLIFHQSFRIAIVIEPQDINTIYPDEVQRFPNIWATLMCGGRRDLDLIENLMKYPNMMRLSHEGIMVYSSGIQKGSENSKKKRADSLINRHILDSDEFPDNAFIYLDAKRLPINIDAYAKRPMVDENPEAFTTPQLIIKQSWVTQLGRFTAALVEINPSTQGILCKEGFVSVHVDRENLQYLEAAWLSYNSKVAVYYLLLSSGRFASFIHEIKLYELMHVPVPRNTPGLLEGINSIEHVDHRIRQSFSLKDSEWKLVEDLFNYTLPDFKGNSSSPGRQLTQHKGEPDLTEYCTYFLRVIRAGFGQSRQACATIFQEPEGSPLPIRLVAIHLNYAAREEISVEQIDSRLLLERLKSLNELFIGQEDSKGGIFYQRVARIYDSVLIDGTQVPTIYWVHPT